MIQTLLQSSSASFTLFSFVCRLHVRNISTPIHACSKHASCSNLSSVFCRPHSVLRSSIPTPVSGTFVSGTIARRSPRVMPSDSMHCDRNRSMMVSRKLTSSNDTSYASHDSEESWPFYKADWSKRELLMCTCCGFWNYRPEGANVIASYIDTAASVPKSQRHRMPTALMIPSGVTDHTELKPLLELMAKSGWRVVIPDFFGMKISG